MTEWPESLLALRAIPLIEEAVNRLHAQGPQGVAVADRMVAAIHEGRCGYRFEKGPDGGAWVTFQADDRDVWSLPARVLDPHAEVFDDATLDRICADDV